LIGWLDWGHAAADRIIQLMMVLLTNLPSRLPSCTVAQLVALQQAELLEHERMNQEMQVASRIQHALTA